MEYVITYSYPHLLEHVRGFDARGSVDSRTVNRFPLRETFFQMTVLVLVLVLMSIMFFPVQRAHNVHK